jgi:hypothetical protein
MQRFRLAPLPEQHIPPEAWSETGTDNSQAVTLTYHDGKPVVSTGEDTPPESPPWRHKSEGGTLAEQPPGGGFSLPARMQNLSTNNGSGGNNNGGTSESARSLSRADGAKGSGTQWSAPSTPSKTSTTAISNKAVAGSGINGQADGGLVSTQVLVIVRACRLACMLIHVSCMCM